MNAAMIELALRSSKMVPKPVIELIKHLMNEGFGAVQIVKADDADPLWKRINPAPDRQRLGLKFRAQSPQSRVTGFIFLEGEDDEVLSKIAALSGVDSREPQLLTDKGEAERNDVQPA